MRRGVSCGRKRRLRIGLVLYGQPRFVDAPLSGISHRWALRRYDYSVFGHMWLPGDGAFSPTSSWTGLGHVSLREDAAELVRRWYPDMELWTEPALDSEAIRRLLDAMPSDPGHHHARDADGIALVSHLYSLHRAIDLVRSSAAAAELDLLVLSRYDLVLWKLPRLEQLPRDRLTTTNQHDRFPDMIVIGSPSHFASFDAWPKLCSGDVTLDVGSPEGIKSASYQMDYPDASPNQVWIPHSLLRSSSIRKELLRELRLIRPKAVGLIKNRVAPCLNRRSLSVVRWSKTVRLLPIRHTKRISRRPDSSISRDGNR